MISYRVQEKLQRRSISARQPWRRSHNDEGEI
jgi:hypothetical protein